MRFCFSGATLFRCIYHFVRFLVLESIIRSLITILSILYCQTTNTSILIISARNTETLAYPVANRNIDVVRNRTSHDAFVHILSVHFGIVLVVYCVYHFRHTSAKVPIQMTNDYIAKQEISRYLCIVSSPLSGKSATVDLNHDSLCIVGFYTTHYPLCYRRKYGFAYMHLCFNPHCCDSFASGYFGHWELSQRNHKTHRTL